MRVVSFVRWNPSWWSWWACYMFVSSWGNLPSRTTRECESVLQKLHCDLWLLIFWRRWHLKQDHGNIHSKDTGIITDSKKSNSALPAGVLGSIGIVVGKAVGQLRIRSPGAHGHKHASMWRFNVSIRIYDLVQQGTVPLRNFLRPVHLQKLTFQCKCNDDVCINEVSIPPLQRKRLCLLC